MKSKYLFPSWCAMVGYALAIPGFILGYFNTIERYEIPGFGLKMREKDGLIQSAFENFTNELVIILVVAGLLLIAFSKTKPEDELTAKLRLNSLYWSVMIYYVVYNLGYLIMRIVEIPFLSEHILEINIFTPLLIFIVRFYYLKSSNQEHYLISKSKLLPNRPFKVIGMCLAIVGLMVLVPVTIYDTWEKDSDLIAAASYFVMVIGLLIWSFSKNKIEDEMMMQQRLESLQLAVYFNYAVLLFATLLFYSLSYLFVLMFAQFSLLLFFVVRMEYVKYRNNKMLNILEGGMGA